MRDQSKKKPKDSRQGTARQAVKILLDRNEGFIDPRPKQRANLLVAFAEKNKVLYGRAFDVIKIKGKSFNLDDLQEVKKNINRIMVYEIKSSSRGNINNSFKNYFFALTTAELLVAQNLKSNFRFIFVNIKTKKVLDLTLKEVFKRAIGIYPTWSIRF